MLCICTVLEDKNINQDSGVDNDDSMFGEAPVMHNADSMDCIYKAAVGWQR